MMKPNPLLHLVCIFDLIGAVLEAIFGAVLFVACVGWFKEGAALCATLMMSVACIAILVSAVLLFVIGRWGDKCFRLNKCHMYAAVVLALSIACAVLSGLAGRFQSSVLIGVVLGIVSLWAISKQKTWDAALRAKEEAAAQAADAPAAMDAAQEPAAPAQAEEPADSRSE